MLVRPLPMSTSTDRFRFRRRSQMTVAARLGGGVQLGAYGRKPSAKIVRRRPGRRSRGERLAPYRLPPAAAEGPAPDRRVLRRRGRRGRAGGAVGRQPRHGRAGRREQRVVDRHRLAGHAADALLRENRAAPQHHVPPGPVLRRGDVRRLGAGQRGPAGLADGLAAAGRRRHGEHAHAAVTRPSGPRLPGAGGPGLVGAFGPGLAGAFEAGLGKPCSGQAHPGTESGISYKSRIMQEREFSDSGVLPNREGRTPQPLNRGRRNQQKRKPWLVPVQVHLSSWWPWLSRRIAVSPVLFQMYQPLPQYRSAWVLRPGPVWILTEACGLIVKVPKVKT